MRRSRLLTLFAALAVAALVATGCGSKTTKTSPAASSAAPTARVKTALTNATKIQSGTVKISGTLSGGGVPGSIKLSGGGPFDLKASGGPATDLDLSVSIAGINQAIGFVTVDGQSYFKFGTKTFKSNKASDTTGLGNVDPQSIQSLVSGLDKYVSDIKQDGTQSVDGKTLDVYTAKVNVAKLATDAKKSSKTALPTIPGLGSLDAIGTTVKDATVSIGIGDDELPHSVGIEATYGGGSGSQPGGINATLVLSGINSAVTIKKPTNVVEGQDAMGALSGLLGGLSGGQ